ncbi:DUF1704 domain-containing protein, partial [Candidatus Gracilibacteria bacterium]|nr:DUF1704 domain-containing protein [Candidatus Gracilibacteria bacterium]
LTAHMIDILDGAFSISGGYDAVLIEEQLLPDEGFRHFCHNGLADIRVIVFNLVPVAAMVRMPTGLSGGKANLAQGGVGFGIDVTTGEIHSFFQHKILHMDMFPEKYRFLRGKKIGYWNDILLYSSQIQIFANLGYLALDWVITPTGPKLLELNARAGLEVQNVNGIALRSRLRKVENIRITDPVKGVEIARSLFHEHPLFQIQEDKILYQKQKGSVRIADRQYENIDIQTDFTALESRGNGDFVYEQSSPYFVTTYDGAQVSLPTLIRDVTLPPQTLILAGSDIRDHFVKPVISPQYDVVYRYTKSKWPQSIIDIDDTLYKMGKKVNLSYFLKPINYYQELDSFISSQGLHNPVFQYDFPEKAFFEKFTADAQVVRDSIASIEAGYSALSQLFFEKLDELEYKSELLRGFSRENPAAIRTANNALFGDINETIFSLAQQKLVTLADVQKSQKKVRGKLLTPEEVLQGVTAYCHEHNFSDIPVAVRDKNFSRISISYGKNIRINLSKNARIYAQELPAILAHEIGVHLQRHLSGQSLGLKIFQFGTGFYIQDEEGLAIYESLKHLPDEYEKNAMYIKYYLSFAAKTMNFCDLARFIQSLYPEKTQEQIFSDTCRIKRGIKHTQRTGVLGYMKDTIYLPGYLNMKQWIESGGDPYMLFQAKIKITDIPLMKTFFNS